MSGSAKTSAPITLVINNFRSTQKLENCLSALFRSNYESFEVIIIDCLTANIESWVKERYDGVKVIHLDYDIGCCAEFNLGLQMASSRSKYILFMDNDVEPTEECLRHLTDAMDSDSSIGAAQPILLKAGGVVDGAGGFIDPLGYPFRSCFSYKRTIDQYANKPFPIFYAETAMVAVRRDTLQMLPNPIAPFDPDYLFHYHDIDLSWKIWLLGYKVVLVPAAISYHRSRGVSRGLSHLSARNMFLNTKNKAVTLIANYSLFSLVKIAPLNLLFETIRIISLLECNPSQSLASLKSYFWVLKHFRSVIKKRVAVQALVRKVPDSKIFAPIPFNIARLLNDYKKHYIKG